VGLVTCLIIGVIPVPRFAAVQQLVFGWPVHVSICVCQWRA
jgi:hypothetical protein